MNSRIPAQLWVGDQSVLSAEVELFLKKQFCIHGFKTPDCFCNTCKSIGSRQHRLIRWITPEVNYTVDELIPLFHISSFSLEPTEQFFFILEKVHTLNSSTANRLLKLLEEPPTGYHFILLTPTLEAVILTIRSRCAVQTFLQTTTTPLHPLLTYFLSKPACANPAEFESELSRATPHETETLQLLSTLIFEFGKQLESAKNEKETHYYKQCINHINNHRAFLPQPGSAQFFWKHFFLTFPL